MSQQPIGYASVIPPNRDAEQLQLLAIFHYIVGGIVAFMGLFALIYVIFGIAVAAGWLQNDGPFNAGFGMMLIAIGLTGLAITWALSVCLILSGRYMTRRKHQTFSIVIAAICCLQVPFGTILGVFTLIVLSRASVKAMYEAATP